MKKCLLCLLCLTLLGCNNSSSIGKNSNSQIIEMSNDPVESNRSEILHEVITDPEMLPEETIDYTQTFSDGRVISFSAVIQDTKISPYYVDIPKDLLDPALQADLEGDFITEYLYDIAEFYVVKIDYVTDDVFTDEEITKIDEWILKMIDTSFDIKVLDDMTDFNDSFESDLNIALWFLSFFHQGRHGYSPDIL